MMFELAREGKSLYYDDVDDGIGWMHIERSLLMGEMLLFALTRIILHTTTECMFLTHRRAILFSLMQC